MFLSGQFKSLFFLSLLLIIVFNSPISPEPYRYAAKGIRSRMSMAKRFSTSYRRCLRNRLDNATDILGEFQSAINHCLAKRFQRAVDIQKLKLTETWHIDYILPKSTCWSCVVARINMGYITDFQLKPEKTLHRFLPDCVFIGSGKADVEDYWRIGKFYEGKLTSFTEAPDHLWDIGGISPQNLQDFPQFPIMVKMKTLLENHFNVSRIDYLWIHPGTYLLVWNNSKSDKLILPNTFFHEYSILTDRINVTVCQVVIHKNFEVVKGVDMAKLARPYFKSLFKEILSKSAFLPLRIEYMEPESVFRSEDVLNQLFINITDPQCVKKFLAPAFCQEEECKKEEFEEDIEDDFSEFD